jgi:predicted NACHT family NTPase
MSEKKYTYGQDNQERAYRVLKVLLEYCDGRIEAGNIKCSKTGKRLIFEIYKRDLIDLVVAQYSRSDWDNDIRPVISHYLEWVGILVDNRTTKQGSPLWKFSLNLWDEDSQKNLQRFRDEWEQKSPDRTGKNNPEPSKNSKSNASSQLDWLTISHRLLTYQKNLTTNLLQLGAIKNIDDVHIPLGLMERKERPNVKQEPSLDRGSELLFQQTELTETKRFEYDEFLAEVVGKRADHRKHITIIGEPGAGKTTLLTKIGEWLVNQAELQQGKQPLAVAWISLAAVGNRRLEDYLKKEWLLKVCETDELRETAWASLKELLQLGRMWLLLDGLDEMSGDSLQAIHRDLGEAWAQNLRVVVTCRLNQWDTSGNSLTNSFEVYRTLDYDYHTPAGNDRVLEFLTKWFEDEPTAKKIRTELDAAGKERIKDLVKNPLRLTLLCASWAENQALPDTQAELYLRFVNYLYRWKEREFRTEVQQQWVLDPALGELAKVGLNRQRNREGAVRRFWFTEREIYDKLKRT